MDLTAVLFALAPSVGLGFLFYKIIRALLEGDRNERLAHARWEAEQDRLAAAEGADHPSAERDAPGGVADRREHDRSDGVSGARESSAERPGA